MKIASVKVRTLPAQVKTPRVFLATLLAMFLAASNAQSSEWLYTVRPDDTIWDLCLRYTHKPRCWMQMPGMNKVEKPRLMPPGTVLRFPVSWLKEQPRPVTATYVTGRVMVRTTAAAAPAVLKQGQKLAIGSVIETGAGQVNLSFGDGSSMLLEPGSHLSLDTMTLHEGRGVVDSQVRLNQGAVKTRVIKRTPPTRFRITTPTAVAAVRGTEYRVSADPGTDAKTAIMRGEVFEGLVDVSANRSLESVAAGFGITAQQGKPLAKPKPLLPKPVFTIPSTPQLLPAQISWEPLDGAASYQLELMRDNDAEQLLQRFTPVGTRVEITDLEETCFRLRLRAIDAEQLQGLASSSRLCIAPSLQAPQLDAANVTYLERHRAELGWSSISGAVAYRVQVSSSPDFKQLISDTRVEQPLFALESEGKLFVRVSAIGDKQQQTEFSNVLTWQPKDTDWLAIALYTLFVIIAW